MAILQSARTILKICGCWKPSTCSPTWKRIAYLLYTIFVFFLLHTFCISQFFNVILNVRTADELSESFYMFIASILSCCKIITLLLNHRNIQILMRKLEEEPCKPRNVKEATIQNKFDKSIGLITICYTIMVEMTVLCMILSSLLTDFKSTKLAYRAWLPFNYSVPSLYYVAYVHQIVALIGTSFLNVACDVILCGLCVHACSQQEILAHRLKEIARNPRSELGKFIRFHNYLYQYASILQEKFKLIIGIQLVSSTLVVCFTLYKLTNTPLNSSKYLQFVLYMVCMMTQIYFYCWYGNQLKLKSVEIVDKIFDIDWMRLDNSTKKSLIMTIRRASNPIEFISVYVFTMDLSTFVSILKMSYSVYNLLQRTKEL